MMRRRAARGGLHPDLLSNIRIGEAVIAEKEEKIEMEGEIVESLRNRMFRVRLDNGRELRAYAGGRVKRYRIPKLSGDRVRIELSPYDLDRGQIVYRLP
jgi:translation initiation factor IF-1